MDKESKENDDKALLTENFEPVQSDESAVVKLQRRINSQREELRIQATELATVRQLLLANQLKTRKDQEKLIEENEHIKRENVRISTQERLHKEDNELRLKELNTTLRILSSKSDLHGELYEARQALETEKLSVHHLRADAEGYRILLELEQEKTAGLKKQLHEVQSKVDSVSVLKTISDIPGVEPLEIMELFSSQIINLKKELSDAQATIVDLNAQRLVSLSRHKSGVIRNDKRNNRFNNENISPNINDTCLPESPDSEVEESKTTDGKKFANATSRDVKWRERYETVLQSVTRSGKTDIKSNFGALAQLNDMNSKVERASVPAECVEDQILPNTGVDNLGVAAFSVLVDGTATPQVVLQTLQTSAMAQDMVQLLNVNQSLREEIAELEAKLVSSEKNRAQDIDDATHLMQIELESTVKRRDLLEIANEEYTHQVDVLRSRVLELETSILNNVSVFSVTAKTATQPCKENAVNESLIDDELNPEEAWVEECKLKGQKYGCQGDEDIDSVVRNKHNEMFMGREAMRSKMNPQTFSGGYGSGYVPYANYEDDGSIATADLHIPENISKDMKVQIEEGKIVVDRKEFEDLRSHLRERTSQIKILTETLDSLQEVVTGEGNNAAEDNVLEENLESLANNPLEAFKSNHRISHDKWGLKGLVKRVIELSAEVTAQAACAGLEERRANQLESESRSKTKEIYSLRKYIKDIDSKYNELKVSSSSWAKYFKDFEKSSAERILNLTKEKDELVISLRDIEIKLHDEQVVGDQLRNQLASQDVCEKKEENEFRNWLDSVIGNTKDELEASRECNSTDGAIANSEVINMVQSLLLEWGQHTGYGGVAHGGQSGLRGRSVSPKKKAQLLLTKEEQKYHQKVCDLVLEAHHKACEANKFSLELGKKANDADMKVKILSSKLEAAVIQMHRYRKRAIAAEKVLIGCRRNECLEYSKLTNHLRKEIHDLNGLFEATTHNLAEEKRNFLLCLVKYTASHHEIRKLQAELAVAESSGTNFIKARDFAVQSLEGRIKGAEDSFQQWFRTELPRLIAGLPVSEDALGLINPENLHGITSNPGYVSVNSGSVGSSGSVSYRYKFQENLPPSSNFLISSLGLERTYALSQALCACKAVQSSQDIRIAALAEKNSILKERVIELEGIVVKWQKEILSAPLEAVHQTAMLSLVKENINKDCENFVSNAKQVSELQSKISTLEEEIVEKKSKLLSVTDRVNDFKQLVDVVLNEENGLKVKSTQQVMKVRLELENKHATELRQLREAYEAEKDQLSQELLRFANHLQYGAEGESNESQADESKDTLNSSSVSEDSINSKSDSDSSKGPGKGGIKKVAGNARNSMNSLGKGTNLRGRIMNQPSLPSNTVAQEVKVPNPSNLSFSSNVLPEREAVMRDAAQELRNIIEQRQMRSTVKTSSGFAMVSSPVKVAITKSWQKVSVPDSDPIAVLDEKYFNFLTSGGAKSKLDGFSTLADELHRSLHLEVEKNKQAKAEIDELENILNVQRQEFAKMQQHMLHLAPAAADKTNSANANLGEVSVEIPVKSVEPTTPNPINLELWSTVSTMLTELSGCLNKLFREENQLTVNSCIDIVNRVLLLINEEKASENPGGINSIHSIGSNVIPTTTSVQNSEISATLQSLYDRVKLVEHEFKSSKTLGNNTQFEEALKLLHDRVCAVEACAVPTDNNDGNICTESTPNKSAYSTPEKEVATTQPLPAISSALFAQSMEEVSRHHEETLNNLKKRFQDQVDEANSVINEQAKRIHDLESHVAQAEQKRLGRDKVTLQQEELSLEYATEIEKLRRRYETKQLQQESIIEKLLLEVNKAYNQSELGKVDKEVYASLDEDGNLSLSEPVLFNKKPAGEKFGFKGSTDANDRIRELQYHYNLKTKQLDSVLKALNSTSEKENVSYPAPRVRGVAAKGYDSPSSMDISSSTEETNESMLSTSASIFSEDFSLTKGTRSRGAGSFNLDETEGVYDDIGRAGDGGFSRVLAKLLAGKPAGVEKLPPHAVKDRLVEAHIIAAEEEIANLRHSLNVEKKLHDDTLEKCKLLEADRLDLSIKCNKQKEEIQKMSADIAKSLGISSTSQLFNEQIYEISEDEHGFVAPAGATERTRKIVDRINETLQHAEVENYRYKQDVLNLKNQLTASTTELNSTKNELSELKEQNATYHDDNNRKSKLIQQLKQSKVSDGKAVEQWQLEVNQQEEKIVRLKKNLTIKEQLIKDLKQKMDKLEAESSAKSDREVEIRRSHEEHVNTAVREAGDETVGTSDSYAFYDANPNITPAELRNRLRASELDRTRIRNKIKEFKDQAVKFERELQESKEEVDRFRKQAAFADGLRTSLVKKESAIKHYRAQVEKLTKDYAELETRTNETATDADKRVKYARRQVEILERQKEDLQRESDLMRSRLTEQLNEALTRIQNLTQGREFAEAMASFDSKPRPPPEARVSRPTVIPPATPAPRPEINLPSVLNSSANDLHDILHALAIPPSTVSANRGGAAESSQRVVDSANVNHSGTDSIAHTEQRLKMLVGAALSSGSASGLSGSRVFR